MHVHIVFAHPSRESFTWDVFNAFRRGLADRGHSITVSDIYANSFKTDMDIAQYAREMGTDPEAPVPPDVRREQRKIEQAEGLAFIYPVWWSDVPAKLKGWFDRVWTFGWAYRRGPGGHSQPKIVKKALAICPAGSSTTCLEDSGLVESMRSVMVGDRLKGIAHEADMEILSGMTGDDGTRRRENLDRAYELGQSFETSTCCTHGPE
jgi:NAD(P)H dehydrogenase (quinone)